MELLKKQISPNTKTCFNVACHSVSAIGRRTVGLFFREWKKNLLHYNICDIFRDGERCKKVRKGVKDERLFSKVETARTFEKLEF